MADGDARETAKTAHEGEVPSTSQSSGAGTGEAAAPGSCSNNTALCFNVGDHTEAITQVVDEYLKKELKKTITQVVDEHVPKYTAAQLRAAREAGAEEARAEAAEGAAAFKRKVSSLENELEDTKKCLKKMEDNYRNFTDSMETELQ